MTREFTNSVRYVLDELLPPVLRRNRYFMYPMFHLWFKGKNVTKLMEFKAKLATMSEEEYIGYYRIYDSLPKRRTDLNKRSVEFIFDKLAGEPKDVRILEVGCGNGYLLGELKARGYTSIIGCDILDQLEDRTIAFRQGNIEHLPFQAGEFDVVICNHTLEHVLAPHKAVAELKRVAARKLLVTVPKQGYNRYTFDLHVNFFPSAFDLTRLLDIARFECVDSQGDWSYAGYL